MRWKGIIFIAILFVIFIILSFLLTDKWLENQLEETGTALIGAQVEVDGLQFSLIDLSIKWQRLQMTNPNNTMRNMIEKYKKWFMVALVVFLMVLFTEDWD